MATQRIVKMEKPFTSAEVEGILNPTVKQWFFKRYPSFSLPQLHAVIPIHNRENILVSAPTGATKTLTGFLAVLNELVDSAEKSALQDKVYAIYISPLKALNNDIHKNLIEPLQEINDIAGKNLNIRVGVRTGDTTQSEKAAMLRKPPHILITTPESLAIVLSSTKFSLFLKSVEWVIVDEIHALAENKRGVHLSLSLERLQRLTGHLTRVGLSATVAPLEDVAQFLVGTDRPCQIVDVQFLKNFDFKVISPVPNLIDVTHGEMHQKLYELMDQLIQEHKTTLIFTNTRAATERVVDHLKHKFPSRYSENIGAHHGSLGKEMRLNLEERLRKGELKVVVCSTSLELGIDIGYIDLVICISSPKSVARFLQRAGRSGHRLHQTVKGRILVMDRDDLVECSVLLKSAMEKKIDRLHIPTNCLDVLAQQLDGMALEQVWEEKELYSTIKQSYCYRDLTRSDFNQVLQYLAGEFVELEDRHVYAKIWRKEGKIGKRGKMGRVIYMTNIGTIPDESFITVKIGDQTIGTLDEGFLERLRPGDVFVLGGETYMFKFTRGMVAQVTVSVNRPPTVPSWASEMLPLSFDLANEIGRFRRMMSERFTSGEGKKDILKFLHEHLFVDDNAAESIYEYFDEQYRYCKKIPTDKSVIVEYFNDGSDKKIIVHSLFGRRVNDCLSRAVAYVIAKTEHQDVEVGMNDNGFYVNGDQKTRVVAALKILKPDKLRMVLDAAIDGSEVFKRRFRHCATRALMILRNYMGHQKRVGRQQVSSMILMAALKRIDPNFSVLKEARREVLEDVMDIENTRKVIQGMQDGIIKLVEMETKTPSPFAFNIALQGHVDVMKIEDKHEFLRRMHQLVLARIAGKEPERLRTKDFVTPVEKNPFKEMLKKEAWNLTRTPRFARAELVRIIDGARDIDPRFIEGITKYRADIEREWPAELRKFLFTVLEDAEKGEFSYDKYWDEQSSQAALEVDEHQRKLVDQLAVGSRKTKLDPLIRTDLFRMIEGDKDKFRPETMRWLKEFCTKTVHKAWGDDIAKFLQKKYEEFK
jgi:ATP-dependent Lhr-like helicase